MLGGGPPAAGEPWEELEKALEPLAGLPAMVVESVKQRMLANGQRYVDTVVKPALESQLARATAAAAATAEQEEATVAALAAVQAKEECVRAGLKAKKEQVAAAQQRLQEMADARTRKLADIAAMKAEERRLVVQLDSQKEEPSLSAAVHEIMLKDDVDSEIGLLEVRLAGARFKRDKAQQRLAALTAQGDALAGEPQALAAARAEYEAAESKYLDGIQKTQAQISKLKWAFQEVQTAAAAAELHPADSTDARR